MEFVPLVAAAALIWKLVDFLKAIRVRDTNAVATQLVVWVAGVVLIWLAAQSTFAGGVTIGDQPLAALNLASIILVGLSFGSSASAAYDVKRAVDSSDSAAQPSLVTGQVPIVPPPLDPADDAGIERVGPSPMAE